MECTYPHWFHFCKYKSTFIAICVSSLQYYPITVPCVELSTNRDGVAIAGAAVDGLSDWQCRDLCWSIPECVGASLTLGRCEPRSTLGSSFSTMGTHFIYRRCGENQGQWRFHVQQWCILLESILQPSYDECEYPFLDFTGQDITNYPTDSNQCLQVDRRVYWGIDDNFIFFQFIQDCHSDPQCALLTFLYPSSHCFLKREFRSLPRIKRHLNLATVFKFCSNLSWIEQDQRKVLTLRLPFKTPFLAEKRMFTIRIEWLKLSLSMPPISALSGIVGKSVIGDRSALPPNSVQSMDVDSYLGWSMRLWPTMVVQWPWSIVVRSPTFKCLPSFPRSFVWSFSAALSYTSTNCQVEGLETSNPAFLTEVDVASAGHCKNLCAQTFDCMYGQYRVSTQTCELKGQLPSISTWTGNPDVVQVEPYCSK